MPMLVAIVLGLLALAFVLYPLYRQTPAEAQNKPVAPTAPTEEAISPQEKELSARTALQEVELDYQLGNISETDYQALHERYMKRALVALKSHHEREQAIDDEIEAQLRKMKESDHDAE